MFRNSKSLLRSKAGKSKGTIIDIPGKPIEQTPITISQPSNSQETNGSIRDVVRGGDSEKNHSRQSTPIIPSSSRSQEKNSNNDSIIAVMDTSRTHNIQDAIQSETSSNAVIVNDDGCIIDVVNQAPQDILTNVALSIPLSKTRSNERQSVMNRTVSSTDNVRDVTQRQSLQKFPANPKIILSFTNDSMVESPSSNAVTSQSNTAEVVESQNARQGNEDSISQRVTVEESDVITEDSLVRSRQRKTTTTNNSHSKKRTRSNDDEQSEDSTVATSSSSKQSKQSKRRKRSSSVASITSSTNTDASSTKSNSTTSGRKRRSKSRKQRVTTRKQQSGKNRVKPWEDDPEDENPLDDSVITMAELCKDLKRGRKSNTYKELEYAKYQKSQQKRRQRAAANNTREDEAEEGGEESTSQHLGGDELDQNNSGDNHHEQNEGGTEQQNEDLNNGDGSENYDEEYYDENGEWEQEGYYDEDGNWIQYENYDENEEYQQDENLEEVEEETQQDENNENFNEHKPTLMKRRVFSSRSSRFVNADGQYIVREGQDSRPRIYENDEGMEVIEEDKFSHIVNSFTYSKKPRKNERWTIDDTELFFKALSRWGTDFEIISRKIFDNRKSRDQVKNKYKRERKTNPLRVYKALDTRIPIEPEELEIISRYTEELAATPADNNTQEETTEVNQDDTVDGDRGGSTGENQEAFDVELDGDHQEELGSVFSFDDYPDIITPIVEMDY